MALGLKAMGDRMLQRRMLRLWSRAARQAATVDLPTLRILRSQARQLRRRLDQVLAQADERLMLPMLGSNAIPKPLHCDWAWRPALWRVPVHPAGRAAAASRTMLGEEVTVFHDCEQPELTLRQLRNSREQDIAPFGLSVEVFHFDGSFLSLAIDLPPGAAEGLLRRHLVRLAMSVETERPIEIFARLNIRHGPNTEQIVRELPLDDAEAMVEFDLAYSRLNEKRVEKLWLDLIFEGPEMNRILLHDITLTRRPRAEF